MFQQRSLTLVFAVKFWFVFRRYVLALLPVGLWRRFKARKFYLSLNWSKKSRCSFFFRKFRHFTYVLLWFNVVVPSFPCPKRLNFEPSQIIKSVISCATRAQNTMRTEENFQEFQLSSTYVQKDQPSY